MSARKNRRSEGLVGWSPARIAQLAADYVPDPVAAAMMDAHFVGSPQSPTPVFLKTSDLPEALQERVDQLTLALEDSLKPRVSPESTLWSQLAILTRDLWHVPAEEVRRGWSAARERWERLAEDVAEAVLKWAEPMQAHLGKPEVQPQEFSAVVDGTPSRSVALTGHQLRIEDVQKGDQLGNKRIRGRLSTDDRSYAGWALVVTIRPDADSSLRQAWEGSEKAYVSVLGCMSWDPQRRKVVATFDHKICAPSEPLPDVLVAPDDVRLTMVPLLEEPVPHPDSDSGASALDSAERNSLRQTVHRLVARKYVMLGLMRPSMSVERRCDGLSQTLIKLTASIDNGTFNWSFSRAHFESLGLESCLEGKPLGDAARERILRHLEQMLDSYITQGMFLNQRSVQKTRQRHDARHLSMSTPVSEDFDIELEDTLGTLPEQPSADEVVRDDWAVELQHVVDLLWGDHAPPQGVGRTMFWLLLYVYLEMGLACSLHLESDEEDWTRFAVLFPNRSGDFDAVLSGLHVLASNWRGMANLASADSQDLVALQEELLATDDAPHPESRPIVEFLSSLPSVRRTFDLKRVHVSWRVATAWLKHSAELRGVQNPQATAYTDRAGAKAWWLEHRNPAAAPYGVFDRLLGNAQQMEVA